jgi:hypothetical protein
MTLLLVIGYFVYSSIEARLTATFLAIFCIADSLIVAFLQGWHLQTTGLGDRTIAVSVSATDFLRLVEGLDLLQLATTDGSPLSASDVVDHQLANQSPRPL